MKKLFVLVLGLIVVESAFGDEFVDAGRGVGEVVGGAVGAVGGALIEAQAYVPLVATAPVWAPIAGIEKAIDDRIGTGCGINAVSYTRTALQSPKDDEFLYSPEAWEDVNRGMNLFSDRAYTNLRGKVWECDNQYCSHNTKIRMSAGHVFEGRTINSDKCYQCDAKSGFHNDKWVEVELSQCGVYDVEPIVDVENVCKNKIFGEMQVGESQRGVSKEKCVSAGVSVNDENGKLYAAVCEGWDFQIKCYVTECNENYEKNAQTGKCTPVGCKSKRSTLEGKACCDVTSSVATWNGTKCVCANGGRFIYEGIDRPYCEISDKEDKKEDEATISSEERACRAQNDVADWNGNTCVCKQSGYVWKNGTCVEGDNKIVNGFVDKIVAIEKTFDTSKWKNAEGKFNTARLASDSIAGVVLGTVGGVVTSTVVKKNQVKNGFEDIKCVIGGQTVASWGDQINVGLQ